MRLARFRVRTLMIAVAAVAAGLGYAAELYHRHERFRAIAAHHATFNGPWRAPLMPYAPEFLAWHSQMQAKYEHAARHPWLRITTDPPQPPESGPRFSGCTMPPFPH